MVTKLANSRVSSSTVRYGLQARLDDFPRSPHPRPTPSWPYVPGGKSMPSEMGKSASRANPGIDIEGIEHKI